MRSFDLGFLGGGQLARMSIQAAQRMGLECLSIDPGEDTPASRIAPNIVSSLEDHERVAELFRQCERAALENEFVPAVSIDRAIQLSGRDPDCLTPSTACLRTVQDKLLQRQAYARHGAPSPSAVAIEGEGKGAVEQIGFPMVLKSRFGGYDGKGTRRGS